MAFVNFIAWFYLIFWAVYVTLDLVIGPIIDRLRR